jgi:uncharacterized protein
MSSRIALLDVLRGFAILGTLGTNIWLFANAGNLGALFGISSNYQSNLEPGLQQATLFFANGKFLGMLSILFGVGLELQYQSAKKRGTKFLPAYLWRTTLLFLDGLLHFVFVIEFDILMGYAATAMIVGFLVTKDEHFMRRVMIVAGAIHLVMVAVVTLVLIATPKTELARMLGDLEEISKVYLNGSYWDGISYRIGNFWTLRAEPIFVIPLGATLFLFGLRLMRAGAFSDTPEGSRITGQMMRWGLGLGVPLNLLALVPEFGLDFAARYVFAPIQAIGYIGLIAFALRRGWLTRVASGVALVGRMALSNYMSQGVLASILFYGWGFGLARQPNAYVAVAAWMGISVLLVVFSGLWLRRFAQGPFETVWKILSDLPFRSRGL